MASSQLKCPECKSVLRPAKPVPDGTRVKCPRCNKVFTSGREAAIKAASGKAPAKQAAPKKAAAPPPPPPKPTDEDEEGGGTYAFVKEEGEEEGKEEEKPDINYAPDESIKDLRGPAQGAVVKPSNLLLVIGGVSGLASFLIIMVASWPFLFSEYLIDHTEFFETYYKKNPGPNNQNKGKMVPKERKDLSKEELAILDEESYEKGKEYAITMVLGFILFLYDGFLVFGAVKMQNLESRPWGIASSVLAMLPFGAGGLALAVGGMFYIVVAENVFDAPPFKTLYGSVFEDAYTLGIMGLIYGAGLWAGITGMKTMMSQEVIDGFNYQAD
jgi:hypothetical protein